MKEALEIDADKRTSGKQPSKRLNRVYNCIESLSEQSGAERRHLVKCELVRREQRKKKKKACKRLSGKSAWKSVMNVGSAVREVK
jgi:hypothetical protein